MSEYEFSDTQNELFEKLANALQRFALIFGIWSAMFVVMALLDMIMPSLDNISGGIQSYIGPVVSIVIGIACVIIAVMFMKPVQNFRRITTTSGTDISELLEALRSLNTSHGYLRLVLALMFMGALLATLILVLT
jgi:hypothetical protein